MTNGHIPLPRPFNVFFTGGMQLAVWGLLVEQDTGFLQRLLLVAVSDPWRTTSDAICAPPSPGYVPPDIPQEALSAGFFTLASEVHAALELADRNSAFEHTASDDDWEAHLLQIRIRFVCLFALRMGTATVTSAMWEWSAYLIEHHRRVGEEDRRRLPALADRRAQPDRAK